MDNHMEWQFETLPCCQLCNHSDAKTIYQKDVRSLPLQFVKCSHCGYIYQNPRLTEMSLRQYFSSSFFIRDNDSSDFSLDDILGYPDYFAWDACYKKTARCRLKRIAAY